MHFNPAALLSFGDALAFVKAMGEEVSAGPGHQTPSAQVGAVKNSPEAAPALLAQMAAKGITSRVPQKYLIQNQSGLTVFYWAEETRVSGR